jgi:hypothetical protein
VSENNLLGVLNNFRRLVWVRRNKNIGDHNKLEQTIRGRLDEYKLIAIRIAEFNYLGKNI